MTESVPIPTPRGRPADARIVGAISDLCDQFAVCGLKAPVAIVVAPGDRRRVEAIIAASGMLLVRDTATTDTTIWGVRIMEAGDHG